MILSSTENTVNFIIGNVIAFVVAVLAIKLFIGFLKKYGFKIWGYYRIILGSLMVIYLLLK
jgi:undecaprenyl-diphosphatase